MNAILWYTLGLMNGVALLLFVGAAWYKRDVRRKAQAIRDLG